MAVSIKLTTDQADLIAGMLTQAIRRCPFNRGDGSHQHCPSCQIADSLWKHLIDAKYADDEDDD